MSNPNDKLHFQLGTQRFDIDQKTLPYILLGGGALILLIGNIGFWNFWPLFVLIPGLALIYSSRQCEGREGLEQFKSGVVTAATGVILMYSSHHRQLGILGVYLGYLSVARSRFP
jgi:hypothetical protein